jgi:hypothetical protein
LPHPSCPQDGQEVIAVEVPMVSRRGRQKGPQQHAEGQHGDKTHERFIEQIHESLDPDEERQRDGESYESEAHDRDGERR